MDDQKNGSGNVYPEDELTYEHRAAMLGLGRCRDGDLLTKRDLARELGCAGRTLQRMVARFELPPPIRLGGRAVWFAGNVKDWLRKDAERKAADAANEAKRLKVF